MAQKKKHLHSGHRDRVKNKAIEGGVESWPYHEVLELMLMYSIPQKDVNPLAHKLIDTFGTFGGVLDAGYEQLCKIDGIGKGTALFLSLLPDVFTKYRASKSVGAINLKNASQCVEYFRDTDRVKSNETFYILCLDAKKNLVKVEKVDSPFPSVINIPRSWFAEKILFKSTKAIVIMHSHPNGDCNPSLADVEATKMLVNTANILGIKVDDHVIITDNQYFSFYSSSMLDNINNEIKLKGYIPNSQSLQLMEDSEK